MHRTILIALALLAGAAPAPAAGPNTVTRELSMWAMDYVRPIPDETDLSKAAIASCLVWQISVLPLPEREQVLREPDFDMALDRLLVHHPELDLAVDDCFAFPPPKPELPSR